MDYVSAIASCNIITINKYLHHHHHPGNCPRCCRWLTRCLLGRYYWSYLIMNYPPKESRVAHLTLLEKERHFIIIVVYYCRPLTKIVWLLINVSVHDGMLIICGITFSRCKQMARESRLFARNCPCKSLDSCRKMRFFWGGGCPTFATHVYRSFFKNIYR